MKDFLRSWLKKDDASAAVEAGFILPVMLTLLLGTVDIGVGISINQKAVSASHQMVDILTRGRSINSILMDDAMMAARLALQPYDTASMEYSVEGVYLNGGAATPTLAPCAAPCTAWFDPPDMPRNTGIADRLLAAGYIGEEGEGVVAVTVRYTYTPVFTQILSGNINIEEVSFSRGRFGGFVTRVYCGGGGEPPC